MTSPGSIEVLSRDATVRDVSRLIVLFYSDPSLAAYLGYIERYAAISASILLHIMQRRNVSLTAILAIVKGKIVGGFLVKPDGLLTYGVVDAKTVNKVAVLRSLRSVVDSQLMGEQREFRLWSYKHSILRAASARDFKQTGRKCYMHTATLGRMRVSWVSDRPSSAQPLRAFVDSSIEVVELRRRVP
jgi:hypothetical protein